MSPRPSPAHVILVGLPGAGKTTVARALANQLGCEMIELDAEIERLAGATIPEIFATIGEAGFRRFEAEATRELLRHGRPALVSAGAGWIANARARAVVLPTWGLVYLRISPSAAAGRLARDPVGRPLLAGARSPAELEGLLEQMARERVPLYERAAATIDTEALRLDEVVREAAAVVAELMNPDPPGRARI